MNKPGLKLLCFLLSKHTAGNNHLPGPHATSSSRHKFTTAAFSWDSCRGTLLRDTVRGIVGILSLPPTMPDHPDDVQLPADVSHHMQHDCRLSRASQIPITWPSGLSDFSCTAVHYKLLFPPFPPYHSHRSHPADCADWSSFSVFPSLVSVSDFPANFG
jgi:hypothetical protein